MVRLRIAALLRARGLTAYGLGRGSGITYPTAYRLAREAGDFSRLERDTLNRLCQFLKVQPGELIEWIPDAEHVLSPRDETSSSS
jgi:putative transcriptional regulator